MKKTTLAMICSVIVLVVILVIAKNVLVVDKGKRIEEIKQQGLQIATEQIRDALEEESDNSLAMDLSTESLDATYGLEEIDGDIYTVTTTYKYRYETSNVHMDIYYVCAVSGNLRTDETTVELLDYYTGEPEYVVSLEEIYQGISHLDWVSFESDEYGESLTIDTNPRDEEIANSWGDTFLDSNKWYIKEADELIIAVNSALGLPSSVRDNIMKIESGASAEYEYFEGYIGYDHLRVAYSFHPNRGLSVTYSLEKPLNIEIWND